MFARFDENPALTLQVIKETKRYGRTDARTDNVKTNKVCGGYNYINNVLVSILVCYSSCQPFPSIYNLTICMRIIFT